MAWRSLRRRYFGWGFFHRGDALRCTPSIRVGGVGLAENYVDTFLLIFSFLLSDGGLARGRGVVCERGGWDRM